MPGRYNYWKKFRVTINTCWRAIRGPFAKYALIRANCANSSEIYTVEILFVQPCLQRYGYLRSLRFAVF